MSVLSSAANRSTAAVAAPGRRLVPANPREPPGLFGRLVLVRGRQSREALSTSYDEEPVDADPSAVSAGVRLLGRSALPALAATFVVALLLLIGPPASAHAMLEGSTPAADAVLTAPPSSVDLVFNEAISLLPDSVRVFGPDGTQVDSGAVAHSHGDAATASVGVQPDLPDGTYLVSYRVVSADSHPVEGAFTFVIGHPSRAPAVAPPVDGSRSVDAALGLSRWLTYAGSAPRTGRLRVPGLVLAGEVVGPGAPGCWWAPASGLTLGTLLALLLKGALPTRAWASAAPRTARLLREVLGTTYGRALDARLLLIAVLVLLLTYREHVPPRWLAAAPGVLLAGTGVTFALCGHAAAGSLRPLAVVSDPLHVAAMSIWLGGLRCSSAGCSCAAAGVPI